MYASGNKLKNNAANPTPVAASTLANAAARSSFSAPNRSTKMVERSGRRSQINVSSSVVAGSAGSSNTPTPRSKFTERKSLNALPLRTRSLRQEHPTAASTTAGSNGAGGERRTPTAKASATTRSPRIWNRHTPKEVGRDQNAAKPTATTSGGGGGGAGQKPYQPKSAQVEVGGKAQSVKVVEKVDAEAQHFISTAIQTNEPEILNHDLLIGDIKFLLPSQTLIDDIDRSRQQIKQKTLLKAHRKFEEHSKKQEEHLTDLKEFLEKAVVSRRVRKMPRVSLELDRKLINQMDEILSKEVPRTESITDIKGRIKKKEQELLNLFETVENIQIFSATNKK